MTSTHQNPTSILTLSNEVQNPPEFLPPSELKSSQKCYYFLNYTMWQVYKNPCYLHTQYNMYPKYSAVHLIQTAGDLPTLL